MMTGIAIVAVTVTVTVTVHSSKCACNMSAVTHQETAVLLLQQH